MPKYNTLGSFISAKRHEHKLTYRQVSEMIGISPDYYCDIEKNRRNPPDRETLVKMIDALQLSEGVLFLT